MAFCLETAVPLCAEGHWRKTPFGLEIAEAMDRQLYMPHGQILRWARIACWLVTVDRQSAALLELLEASEDASAIGSRARDSA